MSKDPTVSRPFPELRASTLYSLWVKALLDSEVTNSATWERLPVEQQALWTDFARHVRDYVRSPS